MYVCECVHVTRDCHVCRIRAYHTYHLSIKHTHTSARAPESVKVAEEKGLGFRRYNPSTNSERDGL